MEIVYILSVTNTSHKNNFRHLIVLTIEALSAEKNLSIKSQSRHVIILGFFYFLAGERQRVRALGKCVYAWL